MEIVIRKTYLRSDEILEGVEVQESGRVRFYSYSYRIRKGGRWVTIIRWDNFEGMPHLDRYDESGTFIESRPTEEKRYEEVYTLVRSFRRGISSVEEIERL